jgi:hypothetical protein
MSTNHDVFNSLCSTLKDIRACATSEKAMCLLCKPSLVKQTLCNLETIEPTSDTCEYKPTPGLARLLLTAFLVHAHPTFLTTMVSESIDSQDTSEEEVRKALTSTVIAKTDTLIETLTNRNSDAFVQALFEFRTSFEAWKSADRIALLKVLVTSYVNLSSSVAQLDSVNVGSTDTDTNESTPTPSTLRQDLCESMRDIESKALRLGVSKTQFHMHIAVATPLPTSDNEDEHDTAQAWDEAVAAVSSVCERAFWDVFTEKLQNGDFDPLRVQLREVVDKLKALTPNRADLHTQLDEAIDVELIVQMASHDALDEPTFRRVANTLVDTLISLQAPAATPLTQQWKSIWEEKWCDGTHTYETLLPPFFRALHTDIDTALCACARLRDNTNMNG